MIGGLFSSFLEMFWRIGGRKTAGSPVRRIFVEYYKLQHYITVDQ